MLKRLPIATQNSTGCSKRPSSKAAASEEAEAYVGLYVEPLSDARTPLEAFFNTRMMQPRCSPRIHVRYPASVQTDDAAGEGLLFDLSATGCRMQSAVTMQPGTYLALHIDAPEEPTPLAVEVSVVRWCRNGQFGIEFLRYANGDRTRVSQLVEELPLSALPAESLHEASILEAVGA